MLKVVLDTNVLISGVIASGYLLEEFSDVITRRHIARKYPKAAEHAEALLDFLRAFSILAPGIPVEERISADRDDDFVLACAADEKADAIVSGDLHLLDLKNYQNIPVLTPKEFVTRFMKR